MTNQGLGVFCLWMWRVCNINDYFLLIVFQTNSTGHHYAARTKNPAKFRGEPGPGVSGDWGQAGLADPSGGTGRDIELSSRDNRVSVSTGHRGQIYRPFTNTP
jgi:hypothetical protein